MRGNKAHVAFPGEQAFESATRVFNLAAPAEPAAAMTARTVDDVRAALAYARIHRLRVRVHTTGHASGCARPMRGSLLVRTELAGPVEVDADRAVARIPAGTRWGTVLDATTPHGLAPPHGSAATVGVVGYLLRGGISCYGRRTGLASNHVTAIELVTADGELRRVDSTDDPELFWALRGGGGGFGVVTAVEVALFPVTTVVTGATFWPVTHADRLVPIWLEWARQAPREISTSLRVLRLPPVPDVPPELAAGPVLGVDGVVLGEPGIGTAAATAAAEQLLAPLRSVAEPVRDDWHVTTPAAVLATHMDPSDPVPYLGDHMLLHDLDEAGAAEFVRVLGEGSGSPLVMAGLRQLGGALSNPDPSGGVLSHLDAGYVYSGSAVPHGPVTSGAIRRHLATVRAALTPWDTARTAPTFVESHEQPQGHLGPEDIAALDLIRSRVDPSGLFREDIMVNATAE